MVYNFFREKSTFTSVPLHFHLSLRRIGGEGRVKLIVEFFRRLARKPAIFEEDSTSLNFSKFVCVTGTSSWREMLEDVKCSNRWNRDKKKIERKQPWWQAAFFSGRVIDSIRGMLPLLGSTRKGDRENVWWLFSTHIHENYPSGRDDTLSTFLTDKRLQRWSYCESPVTVVTQQRVRWLGSCTFQKCVSVLYPIMSLTNYSRVWKFITISSLLSIICSLMETVSQLLQ